MKTDEELASEFNRGSDLAFAALYNRYKQPIYLFALKMLADSDEAKDTLQTVFLKVYERREGIVSIGQVKSWLFTVARNHCLNELRNRAPMTHDMGQMTADRDDDPLVAAEKASDVRLVEKAMGQLNIDQREVLILREYQNLSYDEIAAATGASESAVKSRLFKARRRMFEILKPILWKG